MNVNTSTKTCNKNEKVDGLDDLFPSAPSFLCSLFSKQTKTRVGFLK